MNYIAMIVPALNRLERWQALRRGNEDTEFKLWLLALLGGVFALFMLWCWRRQRKQRPTASATARRAFSQLARAIDMTGGDERFLVRLARRRRMPSAITLVACPRVMRLAAADDTRGAPRTRRAIVMRRIAGIRRRVYGA